MLGKEILSLKVSKLGQILRADKTGFAGSVTYKEMAVLLYTS